MDKLDLEQVRRTGERARDGLDALAREFREVIKSVRGAGVMLGFDVLREDWRDALIDRAFRRGLVLLSAGERAVRFYPRYDTEPAALDEGLAILRAALEDLAGGRVPVDTAPGVKLRVGTLTIPLDTVEVLDLTPTVYAGCRLQILAVERERYGSTAQYPDDVLRAGPRPLLQFPIETLDATASNPGAIGLALRDRVSGRFVSYVLGSALEGHNDEGTTSDPHFGDNNTFFLQAMATLPTIQNDVEIENMLLEVLRLRAIAAGFAFFSTLIEARLRDTGPVWLRHATVLERIDNYLRSGIAFEYLQVPLSSATESNQPPSVETP
jgi:hypothetical protein